VTTEKTRTSPAGRARAFETRHDLAPEVRERMVALLNQQLADTFDLLSQTKQAHWNVKGPDFYQLHELFDRLAEDLLGFVDEIAERATALGGLATGTVTMAAAATRLPDLPLEVVDSMATVEALSERYASVASTTRAGITTSQDAGDLATSDLLTEVARGLDKSLYFLESHRQGRA
jgi:starvation-inducible DNA-binding protein